MAAPLSTAPGAAAAFEAVVLRTTRYGESDVVAHLFTLEQGRVGAMAKGGRSMRSGSRLGARVEPFAHLRVTAGRGRGDLLPLRTVELLEHHDAIRGSWRAQQVAAAAFDLLDRTATEQEPAPAAFHLATNLLRVLDRAAADGTLDDPAARALLAAWQLKLLLVLGLAPALTTCVRCGRSDELVGFSADEGGSTCRDCAAPGDRPLRPDVAGAAVDALQAPLAAVLELTLEARTALGRVTTELVAPLALAHAGVRAKVLAG